MKFKILTFKSYIYFLISIITINSEEILNEENPSQNIAVIPFKIFYPPKLHNYSFSCRDYLETVHSSLPYLEIEIGEKVKNKILSEKDESKIPDKKQYISLFISIDDNSFYIDDNYFYTEEKKAICRYSTQLSTSYEVNPSKNINNKNYVFASDYIKIFSDITLSKYNKIKIEFRHNFEKSKNISFACGKAGLLTSNTKLNSEIDTYTNFLKQIHNNLATVDYSFTFKFLDNTINRNYDGLFIIGLESLEKTNKEELISIYSKQSRYGENYEWRFGVDQVTIGNQFYDLNDQDFIIKTEIDGIEIPYTFYNKLNNEFFNKYYSTKICFSEIVNNYYIAISCNSDKFTIEDIKNFPQINILKFKIGYNFTFSGEELFYKKDNLYIFKIISYLERYKTDFKLGRIFLKKYPIIFNSDSKSILFYKNIKKDEIPINNSKSNVFLLVFSYIFIGILFLVCGIYFGRKFCNMRKKIYANELEDDNYVYVSKEKGNKKERKLIDL